MVSATFTYSHKRTCQSSRNFRKTDVYPRPRILSRDIGTPPQEKLSRNCGAKRSFVEHAGFDIVRGRPIGRFVGPIAQWGWRVWSSPRSELYWSSNPASYVHQTAVLAQTPRHATGGSITNAPEQLVHYYQTVTLCLAQLALAL